VDRCANLKIRIFIKIWQLLMRKCTNPEKAEEYRKKAENL